MSKLKFNKELTGKRQGKYPSIVFRKLADTGNEARYQGSINKKGVELIKLNAGAYIGLKVMFSDDHSIIGFEAITKEKGVNSVFGATELFKELNLVVGKHYDLTYSGESLFTIDSDEFKDG